MNETKSTTSRQSLFLPGVVLLIGLAVVPYGWVAEHWAAFDVFTNVVFGSELAHMMGHFAVFALIGTAVLTAIPRLRHQPRFYLALILALGIVQEGLQLTSFKHRALLPDEFFDVLVDLLGAGFVFFWLTCKQVQTQL